MNIRGRKITLRAIEIEDLPLLHKWANDPETQDGVAEQYFPSSKDYHLSWFQKLKDDSFNQRFIIEIPGSGNVGKSFPYLAQTIGLSSLVYIDWRNRSAHHGLTIGENSSRGKGYGYDAIMATMRYAFEELGFKRLNGGMVEYNSVSRALYHKLGWKDEGIRRNAIYRKGQFWNYIHVGITLEDYHELILRTEYWRS